MPPETDEVKWCHKLADSLPLTGSVSGALTTESFLPPNEDPTAESETPPTVPDEDKRWERASLAGAGTLGPACGPKPPLAAEEVKLPVTCGGAGGLRSWGAP